MKISNGVDLTLKPTKKFKTNRILVSFTTNISTPQEITARTLLADLLESTSQKWPTQRDVALKLSDLYGASFGTSVSRYGQVYGINFIINVVNDNFLPGQTNLLQEAFAFLRELIFAPQIKNGQFDSEIFGIQKSNLKDYLHSLTDNKQGKALTKMNALYFRDQLQQIPPVGQADDVASLDEFKLAEYYQKMLNEDQVQIVVSGDVTETQVKEAAAELPFAARQVKPLTLLYSQQSEHEIRIRNEYEKVSQSKLNLAYNLPVELNSAKRYAAMVFNEAFGGSALSLLFQNVREKNSLAYYAESDLDLFRQELWVQTGIQAQNKDQVLRLVNEQLKQLQAGQLDAGLLEKIKLGLISSYISRTDNQSTALSRALSSRLLGKEVSESEWVAQVAAVQVADVAQIAQGADLQAVYFLSGGDEPA